MRGLKVAQFGLFLLMLGFVVYAISLAAATAGSVYFEWLDDPEFGVKAYGFSLGLTIISIAVGALGKILCVAVPEEGARNWSVISILGDATMIGCIVMILDLGFFAIIGIVIGYFMSFLAFLKFVSRMGDNVGEERIDQYVSLIVFLTFASAGSTMSAFKSKVIGILVASCVSYVLVGLYIYTLYSLFRALPLYIEEVRLGLTDPTESGAIRKEKERKERQNGPQGKGAHQSKPPEEPKGSPPPGASLYRIPKALEPIHLAAKEGDSNKVEMRLAHGDNPRTPVKHGLTPMHIAASVGVMDVADLLLKVGAPIDETCENGLTPLYFAIQNGNPNVVGYLVNKGANLHHRNLDGYTPLHWACCAPHPNFVGPVRVKMVSLLLELGADVHAKTNDGQTPRDLALANQLEETIGVLDRHMGVSTSIGPSFQQTEVVVATSTQPAAFKPFVGTHLSTMPKQLPELLAAVKEGDPEKIKRLVMMGGNINETIEGGLTPIHITAITGVMSGTDLLLSLGAGVNDTCDHGLTPMFLCVHMNNFNMIGYLVSRGANINQQDELGRTPLHWAAAVDTERLVGQNRTKITEFLIANGANPEIKDHDGLTALDLAEAAGFTEVAKLLTPEDPSTGGGGGDDDYYV